MCGIAGAAWDALTPPLEFATLKRMTTVLSHRGPDDAGYFHSVAAPAGTGRHPELSAPTIDVSGPGAALGHRRLSIIDLAGGHQPLSNEEGTIWVVFNGEIYNYRELQPGLVTRGHRFRTSSDTETIVHLYEEYGPECVQHLRGMFAFAVWDQRRRQLFLARDRIGKKPLVYRHDQGRLLFGSELKALLQVPGIARELDPIALDEYLTYQYVPHPHCILRGFNKLPPAHWAMFRDGRLEVCRYWAPPYERTPLNPGGGEAHDASPVDPPASLAEAQRELRETLTEAVRLRLRSDVPLGAFLSGGIDSTIVTGLMQQLSDRPVQTFSIGFPVKDFDERSYARQAAEHLHTDHHEQVVEPSALAILPKLIWQYDEPFADSSAIPMLYLSEMTRRNVTVALSGDGGDELFAGYDRYQAVKLGARFDRLPGFARQLLTASIWQRLPASTRQKSRLRQFKRLLAALGYPPERRYLKWISIFDDARLPGMYSDDFRRRLEGFDPAGFLLAAYAECPTRDFVTRTTCADVLTYLPCDILTKVDIASMTYGLEARCPFLDHKVVEFAARLPIEWKLKGSRGKKILVDTFADLLPRDIQRRKKMGFGVPLGQWFRHELRPLLQDVLLDRQSLERGIFRPEAIRQLVEEHVENRWDHSYRLWPLLVLELWQQKFLDA
ncbi:MAG: asparagine synthase (glutamine-hydrolyzing) [Planctomycetaceae bacterium]|nr:asparagine synthase (glutamine-hydrolyzing) [Planctomycetaceae bacterium]